MRTIVAVAMAPKRKYATEEEKKAAAAARAKQRRNEETSQERKSRLAKNAVATSSRRCNESENRRSARRQSMAARSRLRLANETEQERDSRLQHMSASNTFRRENETVPERAARLQGQANRDVQRRRVELIEEASRRRNRNRVSQRTRRLTTALRIRNAFQATAERFQLDENVVEEHSCGLMNVVCLKCKSKNFVAECPSDGVFSQCCQKGKVSLTLPAYPDMLMNLMKGTDSRSKNFLENIRCINSSFAFASMGATIKTPSGIGPYCFRIHGQIYHRTGTLHPADGKNRKFAQLYIMDPSEATEERLAMDENKKCDKTLMEDLAKLLDKDSPFVAAYKMLRDVEEEAKAEAQRNQTTIPKIVMAFKQDSNQDSRRYNKPRVCEVAVVFENDDGEPPFHRDILVHLKPDPTRPLETKVQRISLLHPYLDALVYPLFYPAGHIGWSENMAYKEGTLSKRKRVTQLQYYSYMLSVRDEFNPLLNAGKLTQQFIVDAYVKIEANRLNYIRTHQKDLRVEDYVVVRETLAQRAHDNGSIIGKKIILPSSFEGSPRNMNQRYQDAMAIVCKFGKPDLFITMTCNPKWKEILESKEQWQNVEHRPDLVARVFRLKLKSLLNDLEGGLFGKVTAMVYVIEFQKRGLPHAHILLILDRESKLRTEDDIDRFVSAEIPDKNTHPILHAQVLTNMIHRPCGAFNPNSPCMDKSTCTKGYPKNFAETTLGNLNGYPIYRRRKLPPVLVNGKSIDNSWVVPYNAYLLKKYNCHINVEVCASIQSVKYLFKYVYKGHDCAGVDVINKEGYNVVNHDESTNFVDSRYVSAPEAAWRILAFPMHHQSHTIMRLAIHLPGAQPIYFNEADESEELEDKLNRSSTLMSWFELNSRDRPNDPDGFDPRQLFYREVPEHYVLKKGKWEKRQRGGTNVIGRMYTVNFLEGERYYLRLLLLHVKGATSFDSLRTYNGIIYPTFMEAAYGRGLLLDDNVWRSTIEEAAGFRMPSKLRDLFAYICIHGNMNEPRKIWDEFKVYLIEDYCWKVHKNGGDCLGCEGFAVMDVQDVLATYGKSYKDFGLSDPVRRVSHGLDFNVEHEAEQANTMRATLNAEQAHAFDTIISAVYGSGSGSKCFFIDGPGGSGKTYLYQALMHHVRGNGDIVLPAATTGIAANLLHGGRTMHSLFGLPIPIHETSVSTLDLKKEPADLLRKAKLLIVDECTMASKFSLNVIDLLLREVMTTDFRNKCTTPFGGKVVVFGGDFRQCLPVVRHGTRSGIVAICLKNSALWDNFTRLPLINNMRSDNQGYKDWLLELGNGTLSNDHNLGDDIIEIPGDMVSKGCIVTDVFGENFSVDLTSVESIKTISSRAILCPKNEEADELNLQIMDRLEGSSRIYLSDDSVNEDSEEERTNFPVEFLNSLTPSGMPKHNLKLKVGAIVMLLRNLNVKKGLCNGTRLIVTKLANNIIEAKVLTGSAEGDVVFIPRIDLAPSDTGLPFKLKRRQFPVKVAFAMTINKSQGQTLERVGIYLKEPVFGHGQLYVAFSRVKKRSHLKIKVIESHLQGCLVPNSDKVFIRNVVYKNVL